jgi:hypothetical protein
MLRWLSLTVRASLLLAAVACAGAGNRGTLLDVWQDPSWPRSDEEPGWWSRRLQDLLDVLPISIGVGKGVFVGVRLPMIGTGLGWTGEVDRYGWATTPTRSSRAGSWHETGTLGVLFAMSRAGGENGYDMGYVPIGPWENQDGSGGLVWPQTMDVEAEVHLGFIGLRAGFSLLQFLDFFTSMVGWDMVGDDRLGHARASYRSWRAPPVEEQPGR